MKKMLLALSVLSTLTHSALAALPIFDPFANAASSGGTSYSPESLLVAQTNANGDIWSGIDTFVDLPNAMRISSNSLSYAGLPPSTGKAILASNIMNFASSSLITAIQNVANAVLVLDDTRFDDGSDYWEAAPAYQDAFTADTYHTFSGYTSYFTAAQISNFFTKLIAARDGNGDFPIALLQNGDAALFYSGFDYEQNHVTGDGNLFAPRMERLYYDKSSDITVFASTAAYLKTALLNMPRDPDTGLVTVNTGNEWVPWGFEDAVRMTGNVLTGSLFYYKAATDMAYLYTVEGDTNDAALFTGQATTISNHISLLWDGVDGMYYAATLQNNQIDVMGSAYAVYIGLAPAANATAIGNYLASNYSTLTQNGYIHESPQFWAYTYRIGDQPAGNAIDDCTYDNGRWSVGNEWVATAINNVNPALAVQFMTDFSKGTNLTMEFWASCAGTLNGQTNNLESPMGALGFTLQNPFLFSVGGGGRMFFAPTSAGWIPTNANGSIFYSMLLQAANITHLSASGDFFCGFNNQTAVPSQVGPPTDYHARIYLKKNGAGFQVGISKNGNPINYDPTVHATNETLFVVVEQQIVWNPANPSPTDDNVFLWINPATNTFGGASAPSANASVSGQDTDESGPVTCWIMANRSTTTPDALFIQNVRLATNWAFVTGAPGIETPPANALAGLGGTTNFSVTTVANGSTAGYRWYQNGLLLTDGGSISGSSTSKLTITGVSQTNDGTYVVVVTNAYGAVSNQAVLTVTAPPWPFNSNNPVTLLGGGAVRLNFSGPAGSPYRLWATTNLALSPVTNTWTLLTNGAFSGGADTFPDSSATNRQKFYTITQP